MVYFFVLNFCDPRVSKIPKLCTHLKYAGVLKPKCPKKMPNINYVLFGYHIYYGNPKSIDATLDPGFTQAIFETKYNSKSFPTGMVIQDVEF